MRRDLTAQEAADYLGVSRATLYAYVSRGLVTSEPVRGSSRRARRYPLRALETFKTRRDPAAKALQWGVPVLESSLSLIDGGRLWYRGRDACELSRTATLEEVASLLWTGTTDEAQAFFPRSSARRPRRGRGSPADRLIACLVEQRTRHPLSLAEPNPATLRAAAHTISALFDAVGAAGTGTLAERLAHGWRAPNADDLRAALVLCADHELNTSAFTARCVASTDAPFHNALLAALCALEGRRHGGAATAEVGDLLDEIERLGAERACGRALARRGGVAGFGGGHRLYPDGDPRAAELIERLDLASTDGAAQAIAFAREYGGRPSLEFALAALARRASLPEDAAFALFALGRSVGWVAHALEAAASGTLIRPRARYTGPAPMPRST
jgi:citrate synthase